MLACLGAWATLSPAHQDHAKVDRQPQAPLAAQQPVRGKIQVVEYFWYGSAQARTLEPELSAWVAALPKDVVFRREHVLWGGRRDIDTHARLFATLRTLKLDELQLAAIFAAYHEHGMKLADDAQVFAWVKERGIDPARFAAAYRSGAVDAQLAYAKESTGYFVIETVPAFVIDGRHVVTAYFAAGHPGGVLARVDEEVAKQRERSRAAKAGSKTKH
jgi:thiol:disulfide interchange protein DsbA